MNYKAIYDRLMERARTRKLTNYSESHHVIPRCMGGTDERANLVRLTPEEHLVAHELLIFIHPTHTKLVYALLAMTMNAGGTRPNNKMFGWMRRRVAKAISNAKTGIARPRWIMERMWAINTGKKQAPEWIEKQRKAMKGRAHSPEHNAKVGRKGRHGPMTGRHHSPETKEKMRIAAEGRKHTEETVAKLVSFSARQTQEQRSARAHKAWVTKRAKADQLK